MQNDMSWLAGMCRRRRDEDLLQIQACTVLVYFVPVQLRYIADRAISIFQGELQNLVLCATSSVEIMSSRLPQADLRRDMKYQMQI